MATKGQIIRLAARIEGLAQQSDGRQAVACVWRNPGETEDQALERHYVDRPGDRAARDTYVFGWLDSGAEPQEVG
jgi:hypothetical protein